MTNCEYCNVDLDDIKFFDGNNDSFLNRVMNEMAEHAKGDNAPFKHHKSCPNCGKKLNFERSAHAYYYVLSDGKTELIGGK